MSPSAPTVFFLCAGLGTRLRPLTDRLPKPLIPFLGKTALEWNLEATRPLSPSRRLCNAHHLTETIAAAARRLDIAVLREDPILGTGGCLGNAREHLKRQAWFCVHNGDILHAIDLAKAYALARESGCLGCLLAAERPRTNSLVVDSAGLLTSVKTMDPPVGGSAPGGGGGPAVRGAQPRKKGTAPIHGETTASGMRRAREGRAASPMRAMSDKGTAGQSTGARESEKPGLRRLTFTGIAYYHRRFLDYCDHRPGSVVDFWRRALDAGESFKVLDVGTSPWYDVGTPENLWQAAMWRLRRSGLTAFGHTVDGRGPQSFVSVECGGYSPPDGLRQAVILEPPEVGRGLARRSRLVVGRDFCWEIPPSEGTAG